MPLPQGLENARSLPQFMKRRIADDQGPAHNMACPLREGHNRYRSMEDDHAKL